MALALAGSVCAAPLANAAAAPAADDATTLAPVIVTAERREENLQVVPAAVTVVSGKTVEDSNFRQVTDLQYVIPGVQYDPTNGSAFQIRGVGTTSFDFSTEKSVSVVVDDVVMDGQRDSGLTGLTDIKNVEALMGPQGTLFGKNSTSGVIQITTNNPVLSTWQAKGGLSYGERNDYNVDATINAPIGGNAAIRVTAFTDGQDGYGKYTTLGKTLGAQQEYGYRAKLLWQPISKLQIILSNDYARHWDNSIRTAVSGAPAFLTALQNANGVFPNPRNADNADSRPGSIRWVEYGDSLRLKYQIGGDTITSITAYRATRYVNDTQADLVPISQYAYIPFNNGDLHTSKFSQEFRWASPTGQFFEYLGGVFYNKLIADQTQLQWATAQVLGQAPTGILKTPQLLVSTTSPGGNPGNTALFMARNQTAAVFGQIKFNLTEKFNIAFGGRYTYDHNTQSLSFPFVSSVGYTGVVNPFVGATVTPYQPEGAVTGHNFSYRIAPQYKVADNLMVYATYSTGYKPGGVAFVSSKYDPFKEETVYAWELGEKSEWFEHRLRFNLDAFVEHFSGYQATTLVTVPGIPLPQGVIGNAGGLTSKGAEATFDYLATDALSFSGSVTYADTEFTNYRYCSTAACTTIVNYTKTTPPNAPRWSGFISATYKRELFSFLKMDANLQYAYRSKIWAGPAVGEPAYALVAGYGLFNGRVSFSPKNSALQFGVYGRNLLNQYFATGTQNYGISYLHYSSPDAYRTVGVFAKYAY